MASTKTDKRDHRAKLSRFFFRSKQARDRVFRYTQARNGSRCTCSNVVDGLHAVRPWEPAPSAELEEERRLLYVAMTPCEG